MWHYRHMRPAAIALLLSLLALLSCGQMAPTVEPAAVLAELHALSVAPEHRCSDYDRDDYPYPQTVEAQIAEHLGGIWSPYTLREFSTLGETQIEHIVALSEAHDSGLCGAAAATRRAFAEDLDNLTLASPEVNRAKSGHDAAEWLPEHNRCWFAGRVVAVRAEYGLTIDSREYDQLERVLGGCKSVGLVGVTIEPEPEPELPPVPKPTPPEDILLADLLPDPTHSFPVLSASHRKDWSTDAVTVVDADIVRSIASDGSGGFVVTYETPEQGERVVEFDTTTYLGDRPGYKIESIDRYDYWLFSMTQAFNDGPSNAGSSQFDYLDANVFTVVGGGVTYRNFLVYGVETEVVPIAGTATYSGRLFGHMYFEDDRVIETSQHQIRGTLALEAEFGAGTIGGSIDSVRIRPPGQDDFQDDPMTISIASSPIEDSGFAGSWSEDGAGGFTGDVEARFYGPAAKEVGGVMTGMNPDEGLTFVGFIGSARWGVARRGAADRGGHDHRHRAGAVLGQGRRAAR